MSHSVPSLDRVAETLDQRIAEDAELTLAIDGGWGEGKTYFWNEYLKKRNKTDKYGYVSVFGLHSLDELQKQVLFQAFKTFDGSVSDSKFEGVLAKFSDGLRRIVGKFSNRVKRIVKIVLSSLVVSKLQAGIAEDAFFKAGWILCVDDVERCSDEISVQELFGYLNRLKIEKKIKIILIYNSSELAGKFKVGHDNHLEKLIDYTIPFRASIKDSVQLVFGDNAHLKGHHLQSLSNKFQLIGLSNIRVMLRIQSHFYEVMSSLKSRPNDIIIFRLLCSIALCCKLHYEKISIPNKSYFDARDLIDIIEGAGLGHLDIDSFIRRSNKSEESEEESSKTTEINRLLSEYESLLSDSVVLILLRQTQDGYLDSGDLNFYIHQYEVGKSIENYDQEFREVWTSMYHGTLRDNREEFAENLFASTKNYIDHIAIGSLDAALLKLSTLGYDDYADTLLNLFKERLNRYFSENSKKGSIRESLFEPLKYSKLANFIDDVDYQSERDNRNVKEIIEDFRSAELLQNRDIARLEAFTVEEIAEFFLNNDMDKLTDTIRRLHKANAPKMYEVISVIAASCEINRMRMESMKIYPK